MPLDFAFLDSGTGGIPYMLHLKQKNPGATCVYVADSAHFPYGEKTPEQITSCAVDTISRILSKWQIGAVVIACNTISVTALPQIRSAFPSVPIVGTVPAIKVAAEVTRNKRIGLLATNATINNEYVKNLEKEFAADCAVFDRADPALISFIEHNLFRASEAERRDAVMPAVTYFADNGCDSIILGCTHFLHMADDIQRATGSGVYVVDSREGVAKQALKVERSAASLSAAESSEDDGTVYVTGFTKKEDPDEYSALCKNLKLKFGGVLSD